MRRDGFTLVEVLIAVALLSLTVTGIGRFMGQYRHAASRATLLSVMTTIAKERLELARGDPRYLTLAARYGAGAGADTTGFPDYPMIRRVTVVTRDQGGAPPRDRTTVTVRVFSTTEATPDTVSLTSVVARP